MAGVSDLVAAILPTGSVTRDADGVFRYTMSDSDVSRVRSAILGILPDPSAPKSGKPLFRLSRMDEAVAPAVLERYGLHMAFAVAGLVGVGYLWGRKR